MSHKSLRAVLVAPHQPLQIWEYQTPDPRPGEILVRVTMGGVCGSDLHLWRGDLTLSFAVVMGHEGVGVIESLGEEVKHDHASQPIAVGDRVYWCPTRPCRRCYSCSVQQDLSSCEDPALVFSLPDEPTFASYTTLACVPSDMAFYRIEDRTPSEAVIALGCALPAMLQGFERLGGVQPTHTVVVQGAGPIGLSAIMLARLAGASRVVVIEPQEQRRDIARRFGASTVLDLDDHPSSLERVERIRELCGGRGADVVVEASGTVAAFGEGIEMLARGGSYLVVGTWAGVGTAPVSPFEIVDRNLRIIGTRYAQPRHYYRAMVLAGTYQGQFPLAECITHRFPLEDSQAALDAIGRGEVVKAVITPNGGG